MNDQKSTYVPLRTIFTPLICVLNVFLLTKPVYMYVRTYTGFP